MKTKDNAGKEPIGIMNCIIVDDNRLSRSSIKNLASKYENLHIIREFENSTEACAYLKTHRVDVVFLDVEMPGMTGLELIRNLERRPVVILITARRNYAVEAYELNVADYMIKPVSPERFTLAVNRARKLLDDERKLKSMPDYIFVRSNSILTRLNSSGIVFMKAFGNRVQIHTTEKSHTVYSNLRNIEKGLPQEKFCRIDKNCLVAIDKIEAVNENTVHAGKYDIPLGKQSKTRLIRRLNLEQ